MPIRLRLLSYACWLLLCPLSPFAQVAGNFHIETFTTENGLPSNGIKGLQWDESTGFLWIATESGIVRFNGVDFRPYTQNNMPEIGSERMLFITRNLAGRIYITDMSGNIFRIAQNKPEPWKKKISGINPYYDYYSLLHVSDTLFGRFFGQPCPDRFSAITEKTLPINDTSCFILYKRSLLYFSLSQKKPVPVYDNNEWNGAFMIENRIFMIDEKGRVMEVTGKNPTPRPITLQPEKGTPTIAAFSQPNLIWDPGMKKPVYIERDRAWLLDYKNGEIVYRLIYEGLPGNTYIRAIQYSEKNQTLYIGTDSKGLLVISRNRVLSMRPSDYDPKNRNSFYSQVALPNGNILTNEGVIIGNSKEAPGPLPIQGKFAYNVSETGDSCLWYYQYNEEIDKPCMHRLHRKTGKTDAFPDIGNESVVKQFGSHIYLANLKGIFELSGDRFIQLYQKPSRITDNPVYSMEEAEPGKLLLATCAGILRFDIATHQLDTLLKSRVGCIRSTWKYGNYIFFGSYGAGYYAYHNGVIRPMPLDKNKYLLYTHCFIPDSFGYCWLSTNRGLFKTSIEGMLRAAENPSLTLYYHYFGKSDGMNMTELNGGCQPCALVLPDQTISFPTMDGLLWVNPSKAIPVLPSGDIFVDEVLVDGATKDLNELSDRLLSTKTGEIVIYLTYSAWCNKENIYLEYQLNDTLNWKRVDIDKEPAIRFNNLPPGDYSLRIRKLNGFGRQDISYKTIRFSIRKPWQQQWWFYLLCLLALTVLVYGVSLWRTRRYRIQQQRLEKQVAEKTSELQQQNEILEKNNSIKTRLISIISHDIVTPLKFLTAAGKNLLEKRNQMPEELQQETIAEMTNTSQELQLLSTNILNWIKYQNENRRLVREHFNIRELVKQVMGILNSLAVQKQLKLVNAVPEQLEVYQFYEPLKILIYNLLTNAISFSEKSDIVISAVSEDGRVRVSVSDQGTGMTPEQVQRLLAEEVVISSANVDNKKGHGLGYLIIKDLIKTMGARLHIESRKGVGTTVSIVLGAPDQG